MMQNKTAEGFVNDLLKTDIKKEEFASYIKLFSKFLGYTNPDYNYNGTYLIQYIDDFIRFHEKLKIKDLTYMQIYKSLTKINLEFKVIIDGSYFYEQSSSGENKPEYTALNKDKIFSDNYEVFVVIKYEENEYHFIRYFDNMTVKNPEKFEESIESFIEEIRGSVPGIKTNKNVKETINRGGQNNGAA